jgi:hypothetical protein
MIGEEILCIRYSDIAAGKKNQLKLLTVINIQIILIQLIQLDQVST